MAANDHVTSTPTAVGDVTPLPPLAHGKPITHEDVVPLLGRLDAALVVVVLAFAFLTASFVAGNSDFFFQMGAGKLLAQGRYSFGIDPFTATSENVYWTNHAWLFGVVADAVYDAFPGHGSDDASTGGVILVVVKALLVTLLAYLLIAVGRRRGQSVWLPAACAALAVLALSPRVWLNSTTLSYVYLGVTLFLLRRPRWDPLPQTPTEDADAPLVTVGYPFKSFWFIPPLCVLWVNTDSWFFLGPLTVALYLAGELIEQAQAHAAGRDDRPAAGELKTLGYVLLVSVAVCFINPHHYHAFALPPQLGLTGAGDKLREDVQFKVTFLSPFEDLYYSKPRVGLSAAGLAYFPLLLLSFLSFGLNYRSVRPWRVLLWLPFAALSAFHARAIPFFAVVAGPVMALNCLEFANRLQGAEFTAGPGWRAWRVGGRGLCVALGLALVVCTIPGWLQAQPFERRRVAWGVHVEPTWKETGAQMARWREQGQVTDGEVWFNTSPDVVNYMAYFCDGQRGFLDARLQLFDDAATDYLAVRKGLYGDDDEAAAKEQRPPATPWRAVFARRGVRYVILHNDALSLIKPLSRMLGTPEEWTPVYADGDTFIFAWNDPKEVPPKSNDPNEQPPSPFDKMRLRYDREAFGPDVKPLARSHAPTPPHAREWYEALWEAEKPRSPAASLALYRVIYEEARIGRWQRDEQEHWTNTATTAELAVGLTIPVALFDPRSRIAAARAASLEPPAPSGSYLSVRQLQKCLADNPDDANAYLALGGAYSRLLWETTELERSYKVQFPHPVLIRHTQIVTALNRALKLDSNQGAAHELLANHYAHCRAMGVPNFFEGNVSINFIDVELKHREEQLRLSKKNQNEPPKWLEDEVKRLKKAVEKQTNLYEISAANKPVFQRAVTALQAGLGDLAQTILEKADQADLFVPANGVKQPLGVILRLKLLLSLGRVDDAKEALTEDNRKVLDLGRQADLGLSTFAWFEVLAAMATGDYATADQVVEAQQQQFHEENRKRLPELAARYGTALLVIQENGQLAVPPKGVAMHQQCETAFQLLEREADLKTLRGWQALEAGDLAVARQAFHDVLEMARLPESDLAEALAVGGTVRMARGHRLAGQTQILGLHSLSLAATQLRWLDAAAR